MEVEEGKKEQRKGLSQAKFSDFVIYSDPGQATPESSSKWAWVGPFDADCVRKRLDEISFKT